MKLNQVLLAIWLLVAGMSIPMTGTAKHPTTAPAPANWQDELSAYLDYVELSIWVDKSTAIVSFRLDERHRIQDVLVIAKDQALVRSIKSRLQGQPILNPCPTITDELGNERCAIRVHFDMQS